MVLPPTCGCRLVVLPLTCSFKLIFWFHQQLFHTNDDFRNSMKEVFHNNFYSFLEKSQLHCHVWDQYTEVEN